MMSVPEEGRTFGRRRFLQAAAAGSGITGAGLWSLASAARRSPAARHADSFSFGLVTDVHYADKPPGGSRHYRDSQGKLTRAVEAFNRQRLAFVVELGDFVDAAPDKPRELKHLQTIRNVFETFRGGRHYVLGNHCLQRLTKEEFLANCGAAVKRSYHSFDCGRYHFVVLDGNFRKDGTPYAAGNFSWTDTWIHRPQQEWLARDLSEARDKKTFAFVHQNLDKERDAHGVKNAPEIRTILENSGNVAAVFQGHMHSGGFAKLGGIHYCTLRAMVEGPGIENNAFAVVRLDPGNHITLEGFGRQQTLVLR